MLRQRIKRGRFCSDCKRDYKTDTGYYEHKCRGGNWTDKIVVIGVGISEDEAAEIKEVIIEKIGA